MISETFLICREASGSINNPVYLFLLLCKFPTETSLIFLREPLNEILLISGSSLEQNMVVQIGLFTFHVLVGSLMSYETLIIGRSGLNGTSILRQLISRPVRFLKINQIIVLLVLLYKSSFILCLLGQ